jgi:hypothetical protein
MSRPQFDVGGIQVIATVLAAVTGAVLASYLGVVGTIVGTAVASGVTTLGSGILRHYLGRGRDRVKAAAPVIVHRAQGLAGTWGPWSGAGGPGAESSVGEPSEAVAKSVAESASEPVSAVLAVDAAASGPDGGSGSDGESGGDGGSGSDGGESGDGDARKARRKRLWIRYGIPAISVFLLVIIGVTIVELAAGKPLSSVVWGKAGSGTSVGSVFTGHESSSSSSTPSATTSAQPSASSNPSSSAQPSATAIQPTEGTTTGTTTTQPSTQASPAAIGG